MPPPGHRYRHHRPATVVALSVAAAVAATTISLDPAGAATSTGRPLADTRPSWATASADRGAVPPSQPLNARVYLAGRDPAGLASYAGQVSDPHSSLFHEYLTPQQVRERFGATAAQRRQVAHWLTAAGLRVTAANEHYTAVTGDQNAMRRAFGTRVDEYQTPDGLRYAPERTPRIPARLSSVVLGITGLSDLQHMMHPTDVAPEPRPPTNRPNGPTARVPVRNGVPYLGPEPCSDYYGQRVDTTNPPAYGHQQPYAVCGYTPPQLQHAYGVVGSGLTGRGVTVAIVDAYASPTMRQDADTYARRYGEHGFAPGQYVEDFDKAKWTNQQSCGGANSWSGEESIDVEAVHATAPDADIVYYGANSCEDQDFLDTFSQIVDHHSADLVSDSWGGVIYSTSGNESQSMLDAYQQLFEQGAVEGIGFNFSSGDCANESPAVACGKKDNSPKAQVDYPSSDPWVTAVGGTALAVGADDGYLWETSWGDDTSALAPNGHTWGSQPGTFYAGGSGGTSDLYKQPGFQRGIVPMALSYTLPTGGHTSGPMRELPDVAMDADPFTGMLVGETQPLPGGRSGYAESAWGGTSLACPLFVGIEADAQQAQHGVALGFANPAIYQRFTANLFHDITDKPLGTRQLAETVPAFNGHPAQLVTQAHDWGLEATPGYDDATGVGSPTWRYLASFTP